MKDSRFNQFRNFLRSKLRDDSRRAGRRPRRLIFDRLEQRNLLATNVIGDFDGNGADDIAIGSPNEFVGGASGAGAVNVIYGTTGVGLTSAGNQFWHQDSSGVLDGAELDDRFGSALATGDFNSDGFDDLAIGVPLQDVSGIADAGVVQILFGSLNGLTATGNQIWHQNKSGILDRAELNDRFGSALAAGDFNLDGRDDLAIGVANEWVGDVEQAGAVNVLYGSLGAGLISAGNQFWNQNSSGVLDTAETGDRFGFALAAGDFNGSGRDDLAIGAPRESFAEDDSEEGAINVLYGSTGSGLTITGNQFWHQNISGVEDAAEAGDLFGTSLAAGDFNGDSRDDLAIGVPLEDIGTVVDAGAVNVLYGSASRLTATGDQFWNQNSSGILDSAESNTIPFGPTFGDFFGASLQAGHFNSDGREDLAIGVPGETLPGSLFDLFGAGAVNVIYGSAGVGLASAGNQFWHQDISGVLSPAAEGEVFGLAVAVGDFNNDSRTDLVIGVPGEAVSGANRAGAVNVLYGSGAGLVTAGNQFWNQDISGILDSAEFDDFFGATLLGGSSLTDIAAQFGF